MSDFKGAMTIGLAKAKFSRDHCIDGVLLDRMFGFGIVRMHNMKVEFGEGIENAQQACQVMRTISRMGVK